MDSSSATGVLAEEPLTLSISMEKIEASRVMGTTQFSLISMSFFCEVIPDLIEIFDGETS